jgi:hypothetical protein
MDGETHEYVRHCIQLKYKGEQNHEDCLLNLNKIFNVLTLNCCGIRTWLNYSEFHELVNDLDVLCLVETKTDDLDEIIIFSWNFEP